MRLVLAVLVLSCVAVVAVGGEAQRKRVPAPVIIELFHSEGCSSCPEVEAFLQRVLDQARKQHVPLYCLGFHVDYFDRLGHADPFADPAHSRRQTRYVEALHLGARGTPTAIINGHLRLSGPGFKGIMQVLANELGQMRVAACQIRETTLEGNTVRATVATKGALEGARLCAAVTESGLATEVEAGENQGKTLRHGFTVRAFRDFAWNGEETQSIELVVPEALVRGRARLIVFFQDPATMRILTAHAVGLAGGEEEGVTGAGTGGVEQTDAGDEDEGGPDVPFVP